MKKTSLIALACFASASAFAADGFRVVANQSVPVTALSKSAASAIFLKKTAKWSDGTSVVPVDQPEASGSRASFTAAVHGRAVNAVKSFWQQQIFSGRDVPPVEKANDTAVLEYIRATPGAIGYVSADAAVTGVRVLQIQ